MKSCKFIMLPAVLLSFSAHVWPQSYQKYQVLKGDTLSDILYRNNIGPLYGLRGKILETLRINQNKIKHEGDTLLPGQTILIPIPTLPPAPETTSVTAHEDPDTETKVKAKNETSSSFFDLHLKMVYFRIDSEDKLTKDTISILSQLSPEIGGSLNFKLDETNSFKFTVASFFYSLQKDDSIQFKNKNGSRTSLSATYYKDFGLLTSLLGLSMKEELFPFSKNIGELSLEKKPIPQFSAGLLYPFFEKGGMTIKGKIGGDYLFSQNNNAYNVSSGRRFWTGLDFSAHQHQLGIFFNEANQNSSIATKKEQQVGMSYHYLFAK